MANIHKTNTHCHGHRQISAFINSYNSEKVYIKICHFRDRIELKFYGEYFITLKPFLLPTLFSYQMHNLGGIEHTEIRVFGRDFTFNAEGIGKRKARDRTDENNTLVR